jgi:hypothetical protein
MLILTNDLCIVWMWAVSEVHAASVFRVEVSIKSVCSCVYIYIYIMQRVESLLCNDREPFLGNG